MTPIRLILDTNVLIEYYKEIENALKLHGNQIQIYLPLIVVTELDNLKKNNKGARKAVNLIKENIHNSNLMLEGVGCLEKMDVESNEKTEFDKFFAKSKLTADDKILKFVIDHRDYVLLTIDKCLYLKARGFGVKCIYCESFDLAFIFESYYIIDSGGCVENVTRENIENGCQYSWYNNSPQTKFNLNNSYNQNYSTEVVNDEEFKENNFNAIKDNLKQEENNKKQKNNLKKKNNKQKKKLKEKAKESEKEKRCITDEIYSEFNNDVSKKSTNKKLSVEENLEKKEIISGVYNEILPIINDICIKNKGLLQKLNKCKKNDLLCLLKFIDDNFVHFEHYFSSYMHKDIANVRKKINTADIEESKKNLRRILTIFRLKNYTF